MTDYDNTGSSKPSAQAVNGASMHRSRFVFINLKNRLHLPGVGDLLIPCTQHLTAPQYKRMLSAWQTMDQYHIYGFVQYGRVIALLSMEEQHQGSARILTVAVQRNLQGRGFGKRLVVESFCSLGLNTLSAKSLDDILGFYRRLHFSIESSRQNAHGQLVHHCLLTKQALFAAYAHEYSAGAALYTEVNGQRMYVLVTELSGNTGLPKGHVEAGETVEQTALREIFEETGIKARLVPGFGGEIVYPQGRGMLKHFSYFLAVFDSGQSPTSGADVIAHLLPYDQALRKLSFADVRRILREAENFLSLGQIDVVETQTES